MLLYRKAKVPSDCLVSVGRRIFQERDTGTVVVDIVCADDGLNFVLGYPAAY